MKVGEGYNLIATVNPSDADDKTLTFSSADEAVATVDSSGRVVGVAEGTVKITAETVNGLTADCTFTITAAALKRGREKAVDSAE